jgi:hypothetical protein
MTFESSTSRLEQELYSLWEFIENGCDARPEDKHDALSTLDRIKLFFSEIQRVGTIGHVHPEVEIGRALATALSGDKQQQFTCPKCGHIGAGPESRLPLCDRCDYRVRMLPSHNGRIFAPRTNAIAKWQEHVTVDDYNRMVDHARELEAELATLAPSHAAPVGEDAIQQVMWAVFSYADRREAFTDAPVGEPRHIARQSLQAQEDYIRGLLTKMMPSASGTVPDKFTLDVCEELFGCFCESAGMVDNEWEYRCTICEHPLQIKGWVNAPHHEDCIINRVRDVLREHRPHLVPPESRSTQE